MLKNLTYIFILKNNEIRWRTYIKYVLMLVLVDYIHATTVKKSDNVNHTIGENLSMKEMNEKVQDYLTVVFLILRI